jgi:DNA-binding transcriptional LysR family regulator
MQRMRWDDLRYLLAIARAGTLAAAARRLGVDQTTVARRLGSLEAVLGTRLFERREGSLQPTKSGAVVLSRAAQIEQEVQSLAAGIVHGDATPAGVVRLTAVPILVNHLLIPALSSLTASHPLIRLELIAEPRNLSLPRREVDIALRLSRPQSGAGLLVRRIGDIAYAAYGPRGVGGDALPWIGYEEGLAHLPQARWIAAAAEGANPAPLAVSDAESILQAIRAGLGRSLLPCFVGDRDPRLQRLAGGSITLRRELWLLTHRDLRQHGRIGAAIGWIEGVMIQLRG